ncbi:MAG: hypothetical protein R8G01_04570 [Ilumatobacteraceae bacterium]|nr:hypothetical protein [Ilumatobacteraceae bacterium]
MPTEQRQHRPIPRFRSAALLVGLVLATSGCFTGQRPELEPVPVIDDAAAQVVLERLERANSVTFTATYDIIPSTTGRTTQATVRQLGDQRRITIGNVDFLLDRGSARTCRIDDGSCVDLIDDALISDLNLTHRFWSDGIAARLAIDAARRVGFSEGHTETIADRPAACADVPVLGGVVVYCALDAGILARYFNADVSIELTSFTNDVDADLLTGGTDRDA